MTPWDRKPTDADAPWAAFRDFLYALPKPRRLVDLARIHPVHLDLLEVWAEHGDWFARAEAWDAHLDHLRAETFQQEALSIAKRQAQLSQEIQGIAVEDIRRMKATQRRLQEAPLLSPRDVARFAVVGMAQERAAALLPDTPATSTSWDLSKLSPSERALLRSLVERVTPK